MDEKYLFRRQLKELPISVTSKKPALTTPEIDRLYRSSMTIVVADPGARLSAAKRVLRAHDLIHEDIALRRFPNNFLPSEDELAGMYGTTRSVVRRVLSLLRSERIIDRKQGVGTFISTTQLRYSLGTQRRDDQYLAVELGMSQVHIVSVDVMTIPATIAAALEVDDGIDCVCLEYSLFVNGAITTVGTSYLLDPLAQNVRPGLYPGGFNPHLRTLGIEIVTFEVLIQAINADSATAEIIGVEEGDALLYNRRRAWDADGRPTEMTFTRHRSERSSFLVRSPVDGAES